MKTAKPMLRNCRTTRAAQGSRDGGGGGGGGMKRSRRQRGLEANGSADISIISSRHVSSRRTSSGTFYMSRVSLAAARLFLCEATRASLPPGAMKYTSSPVSRPASTCGVRSKTMPSCSKGFFLGLSVKRRFFLLLFLLNDK